MYVHTYVYTHMYICIYIYIYIYIVCLQTEFSENWPVLRPAVRVDDTALRPRADGLAVATLLAGGPEKLTWGFDCN